MGDIIRAAGLSLCMLVGSAVPQDAAAWGSFDDFLPPCGSRYEIQYIVQKGDNLWNLSKRFYSATLEFSRDTGKFTFYPEVIARAYQVQNYEIQEGQQLRIPRGGINCPANAQVRKASEYDDVRGLVGLAFPGWPSFLEESYLGE